MTQRVVITGMGTLNPLGLDVQSSWEALTRGASGAGPITLFDPSDLLVQIACEVQGFEPERFMDAREARRRDRFEQLASAAAQEALAQSGLTVTEGSRKRVGVVVSSAVGGLGSMEEGILQIEQNGPRRVSPFTIPMFMPNGASGMIAIDIGAQGPSFSLASACASGADSIGQAALLIRSGVIDAAIAGASEATVTHVGVACFDRLGALTRRNDEYQTRPAPFDAQRDGFIMGEGAAILVLESLEHAESRGASILGELAGYGATSDAYHVTAPSESGEGGAAAIRIALQDAGLNPEQVEYINAHGTGTVLNDVAETRAIKSAFGERAYKTAISSTKSMTGHMMGATGALEAIICMKAIETNTAPPTINLVDPDPECDLDYVPGSARGMPISVALTNAFGFGGHNAVLAFKAFHR
ncbi:MAG: beta-ketoacyl-ACP synthase II [Anaerolineales bacterium]|nr:beta-ketoacyl-ACP synthase II [Anaerolineales bacterium]